MRSAVLIGRHKFHLRQECVPRDLAEGGLHSSLSPASGSQLIRQLPASDRRLTAGGRIRARITIRLRAAAATDRMRLSLVATTGCSHKPLHPFADATPNPLLLELRRAFAALLSLLSSSPSRLGWKSPWSLACRCM